MSVSKWVGDVRSEVGIERSILTFPDNVFMEHQRWRREMGVADQCTSDHRVVTTGNWIFLEISSDWIFVIIFWSSHSPEIIVIIVGPACISWWRDGWRKCRFKLLVCGRRCGKLWYLQKRYCFNGGGKGGWHESVQKWHSLDYGGRGKSVRELRLIEANAII